MPFAVNRTEPPSTLGAACCFVGLGYPEGPTLITHVSAVHSNGYTALHWAVYHGNRRVVRLLIDAKANVNAQDDDGCAFPFRRRRVGSRVPAACRAGARRCTGPRRLADQTSS